MPYWREAEEPAGLAAPPVKERLAINLFDLKRLDPAARAKLFPKGVLDLAAVLNVEPGKKDGRAVAFACEMVKAAVILDVTRSNDRKLGLPETRAYLRRGKVWVKLPADAVLTVVRDGACVLDPDLFRLPPAAPVAPPVKRASF